jgi:hypothetical protein
MHTKQAHVCNPLTKRWKELPKFNPEILQWYYACYLSGNLWYFILTLKLYKKFQLLVWYHLSIVIFASKRHHNFSWIALWYHLDCKLFWHQDYIDLISFWLTLYVLGLELAFGHFLRYVAYRSSFYLEDILYSKIRFGITICTLRRTWRRKMEYLCRI